jgi:TatD DNase family protein
MTLIDTHAHVDAAGGLPALAPPQEGQPATHVIAVTNLPRHYASLHKTTHDRVQWALGLHPAQPHAPTVIEDFLALLPSCAAVGEVGLDGSPATSPHSVPMGRQREELARILNHPATASRLVSIHSRRSVVAVIEHLRETTIPGAVLHWFTGTPAQAVKAADSGAYFSVNNRMGRKQDLLAALPRDRVLLETDAPHTGKTLRPGDLRTALAVVAEAWQTTIEEASVQITTNQERLLAAL